MQTSKGLEVVAAMWLAQDKVGMQEVIDGFDMHQDNMDKFGLPTRLIAKTFVFRILYGGTEYGFVKDPDFASISTSTTFWKEKIELFYKKYKGIYEWHNKLVQTVYETGGYTSPFGRAYTFKRRPSKYSGELELSLQEVKNYPVQGLGADIVMLMRIVLFRRIKKLGWPVLFVNTIHDSIVLDIKEEMCYDVGKLIDEVCMDLPGIINKQFDVGFTLPIRVETKAGPTLADMKLYTEI